MRDPLEEIARYRMAVLDNPPPPGIGYSVTGILSYLHHLATVAGAVKDSDAPKTMPKLGRALPPEQREVRLPYRDSEDTNWTGQP